MSKSALEELYDDALALGPKTYSFSLAYPPSANRYWRNYRGVTVISDEARAYKQSAQAAAREQGAEVLNGPIVLHADVYRPRRIGDLSNRLKVLEDALIGVCYKDDGQVIEIHMRRFDDKKNPRVEITIYEQ